MLTLLAAAFLFGSRPLAPEPPSTGPEPVLTGSWAGGATFGERAELLALEVSIDVHPAVHELRLVDRDLVVPLRWWVDEPDRFRCSGSDPDGGVWQLESRYEDWTRTRIRGTLTSPSGAVGAVRLFRWIRRQEWEHASLVGWFGDAERAAGWIAPAPHGGLVRVRFPAEGAPLLDIWLPHWGRGGRFARWTADGAGSEVLRFDRDDAGMVRGLADAESVVERLASGPYRLERRTWTGPGSRPNEVTRLSGLLLRPPTPRGALVWVRGDVVDATLEDAFALRTADRLARAGIAILLPDGRGAGRTPAAARGASLATLELDLRGAWRAVAEHAAGRPFGVVGPAGAPLLDHLHAASEPPGLIVVLGRAAPLAPRPLGLDVGELEAPATSWEVARPLLRPGLLAVTPTRVVFRRGDVIAAAASWLGSTASFFATERGATFGSVPIR